LRYVDQNPVRAGMLERAVEYAWSSAGVHVGREAVEREGGGLLNVAWWREASQWIDWGEALERSLPAEQVQEIRERTRRGRPLAGEGLVARFEQLVGRRLRSLSQVRAEEGEER
jgi:putative transposase